MKRGSSRKSAWAAFAVFSGLFSIAVPGTAQSADLQQNLAKLKAAAAHDKQNLATYTWQERQTVSIKGEVKKQESWQVRMGADGQPAKTPLNPTAAPPPASQPAAVGRRGARVKERVIENKKEEFSDYAQSVAALAHSYAPPDPAKLQQAQQQGNVKLTPGSAPDQVQLVISSYNKPNDSMTIAFNKNTNAIQSVRINSYLQSPQDAVNIAVQYATLPDGTSHVSSMTLEGVSKQLTVLVANSGYTKI